MRTLPLATLAVLLVSTPALADGAGDASPNATPSSNPKSASDEALHGSSKMKVSLAIERVGGLSWTKASAKDTDASSSLTVFQIGGVAVNPYSAPRLGVDLILESNLTLGAGLSAGRYSISASQGGKTTDLGSLFIYSLAPRVGYRIAASPDFDVTPRAGVTLAGGSVSSGTDSQSAGVFALALSGEVVGAYRATSSFNLLAGIAADATVAASASTTSGNGGNTSTSTDIKGGLFALQLWLGVGGYL
jgi:hypothetical protein